MAALVGYVALALVVMLAVGGITGGAVARARRGCPEHPRDLRMRSAFDEGNDARPSLS